MTQVEIAARLRDSIDEIVTAWMDAVTSDERIQSDDDLAPGGLRDHIPGMMEEVCDLLRSDENLTIYNTREGRVHAYLRFTQGYRARDLVTTMSHLRMTILDRLNHIFSSKRHDLNFESYVEAARLINLYIDDELRYAFAIYTESTTSKG